MERADQYPFCMMLWSRFYVSLKQSDFIMRKYAPFNMIYLWLNLRLVAKHVLQSRDKYYGSHYDPKRLTVIFSATANKIFWVVWEPSFAIAGANAVQFITPFWVEQKANIINS